VELSVCFMSRWCYATYSDSSDEWSPHLLPTTAQEGESGASLNYFYKMLACSPPMLFYISNLLSLRYVPCVIYFYFPLSFSSKKKKPLLQPTPPHSPELPMWKWCMRQLPPLSLATKKILLPLLTLESVRLTPPPTSLPRLLSNSLLHPTLGNRTTSSPLGHRGREKEIKMPLHTNRRRRR
jgi:hypothetical protein